MHASRTAPAHNGVSALLNPFAQAVHAVGAALANGMLALYTANHAQARYEALAGMTDAQLEARGLTRETLVRKVFAEYIV